MFNRDIEQSLSYRVCAIIMVVFRVIQQDLQSTLFQVGADPSKVTVQQLQVNGKEYEVRVFCYPPLNMEPQMSYSLNCLRAVI